MDADLWALGKWPVCEHCAGRWADRPFAEVALIVADEDGMRAALGYALDTGHEDGRLYLCHSCYRALLLSARSDWGARAASIRRGDEHPLAEHVDDDEREALEAADERWLAEVFPRHRSELEQCLAEGWLSVRWTPYGAQAQRARRSLAQHEPPARPAPAEQWQHWWDKQIRWPWQRRE